MKIINYTIIPLFYLSALPICVIIALMDYNNGRTFIANLKSVMGVDTIPKKRSTDNLKSVDFDQQ